MDVIIPAHIDSVGLIVRAIGQGMRLVIPESGEQPYLTEGFPKIFSRQDVPIESSLAKSAIVEAHLNEMSRNGDFDDRGRQIRGGYQEFYSGCAAKIYCLTQ